MLQWWTIICLLLVAVLDLVHGDVDGHDHHNDVGHDADPLRIVDHAQTKEVEENDRSGALGGSVGEHL